MGAIRLFFKNVKISKAFDVHTDLQSILLIIYRQIQQNNELLILRWVI